MLSVLSLDFMSGKMIIKKEFVNFVGFLVKCFYLQLIDILNKILYFLFKNLNKCGKMNLVNNSKMKFLQGNQKQNKNCD